VKHITLGQVRERAGLTQMELEKLSGVDRTRISRLEAEEDPNPTLDTFEKLDAALRRVKNGLRSNEKLIFGTSRPAVAS